MTRERILSEALALPLAERLDMIDQIWESIGADPDGLDLTDTQREVLDRRIDEMEASPAAGIPWAQVKAERRRKP